MLREKLGELSDWAYERTLDVNVVASFGKAGYFMRARYFEPGALKVDMHGRVCVVTGANTGIGFAACHALAKRGATVYLLCRSEERGRAALDRLRAETGSETVHLEVVDVAEGSSRRAFAERFAEDRLDVLVHNAGVLVDERQESSEGIELTWATNVVGPHHLTKLLRPRLERASGRVIWVSSGGMYLRKLSVDDWAAEKGTFDGVSAYANSKRAMVVLAEEWARTLEGTGVVVNAMHPGWVDTVGVERSLPRFYRWTRSILRDAEQGADTIVWLAVSAEGGARSGRLYFDREVRHTHVLPWTHEAKGDRARLWALVEEQSAA